MVKVFKLFAKVIDGADFDFDSGCLCIMLLPLISLVKIIPLFLISMLSYRFIPNLDEWTFDGILNISILIIFICYGLYFYIIYYKSLTSMMALGVDERVRIFVADLIFGTLPTVVLLLIYTMVAVKSSIPELSFMKIIDNIIYNTFIILLRSYLPMLITKLCIIPPHIRNIEKNNEFVEEYKYCLSFAEEFSELALEEGSDMLKKGASKLNRKFKKAQKITQYKSADVAAIALVISMLALGAIRFI